MFSEPAALSDLSEEADRRLPADHELLAVVAHQQNRPSRAARDEEPADPDGLRADTEHFQAKEGEVGASRSRGDADLLAGQTDGVSSGQRCSGRDQQVRSPAQVAVINLSG